MMRDVASLHRSTVSTCWSALTCCAALGLNLGKGESMANPKVLDCPSDWESEKGVAKGMGSGNTKSAARTKAKYAVYHAAISDLTALLSKYKCDGDCQLVVDFRPGRVKLDAPTPSAPSGYDCSGSSRWTARIRCTGKSLPKHEPQVIEEQELACDDQAEGWGSATGKGEGADKDSASAKALEDLKTALALAIEGATQYASTSGIGFNPKVQCLDEDCPKQRIRLRIDPPKVKCNAPADKDGNWKCEATQAWYIRIECES